MAQNNANDPQGQLYGCRGYAKDRMVCRHRFSWITLRRTTGRALNQVAHKSGENGVELPFSIYGASDKVYENNHHCKGPTTKVFNAARSSAVELLRKA